MARRTCTNCGASEWPTYRWCEDCWRMVGKTLVAGASSAFGAWLVRYLLS